MYFVMEYLVSYTPVMGNVECTLSEKGSDTTMLMQKQLHGRHKPLVSIPAVQAFTVTVAGKSKQKDKETRDKTGYRFVCSSLGGKFKILSTKIFPKIQRRSRSLLSKMWRILMACSAWKRTSYF